jgi:antitoxin component of MazEF toxin-antitoxin module
MIKTLTPIGNSLGLIIDRPILNLLNIDRDTALEISTDGKTLTIRPAGTQNPSARTGKRPARNAEAPEETSSHSKSVARSFLDEFKDALK